MNFVKVRLYAFEYTRCFRRHFGPGLAACFAAAFAFAFDFAFGFAVALAAGRFMIGSSLAMVLLYSITGTDVSIQPKDGQYACMKPDSSLERAS